MNVGYAVIQNPDDKIEDQIEKLKSFNCNPIYKEVIQPTNNERPSLGKLLSETPPNSKVFCVTFESIVSTLDSFIKLSEVLIEMKCSLTIIEENITIDNSNIKFYKNIWSELLEFRYQSKSRRTKIGMSKRHLKN